MTTPRPRTLVVILPAPLVVLEVVLGVVRVVLEFVLVPLTIRKSDNYKENIINRVRFPPFGTILRWSETIRLLHLLGWSGAASEAILKPE